MSNIKKEEKMDFDKKIEEIINKNLTYEAVRQLKELFLEIVGKDSYKANDSCVHCIIGGYDVKQKIRNQLRQELRQAIKK